MRGFVKGLAMVMFMPLLLLVVAGWGLFCALIMKRD